jgi:acyl carrier protein
MGVDQATQELIDMLTLLYAPPVPITPETTLADMEIDSLELVEIQLLIEDRFDVPESVDYADEPGLTIKAIAEKVVANQN